MSAETHGSSGLTGTLKTAGKAGGAIALGFDAINAVNVEGVTSAHTGNEILQALGTGRMPITKGVIDSVNGILSATQVQDPVGAATIIGTAAAVTGVLGGRNVKKGNKIKGFSQIGAGLVTGVDAWNVSNGNGLALIRGTKDILTRGVNSFLSLGNAINPEAIAVANKVFQVSAPALYTVFAIYLLDKVGLFGKGKTGSEEKAH